MNAERLLRPSASSTEPRYNDLRPRRPGKGQGWGGVPMQESREQGGEGGAGDEPVQGLLSPESALREVDDPSSTHAEDHALIRRAQKGEEAAFEGLVRRHQARAWRVAKNLVGSDEDARDLVQEAFLRVFRNLASFDFEHGFTTWLYRIVTNLAIDHLRKRRTAISTTRPDDEDGDLDLPDRGGDKPTDRLERHELSDEVRACLESLAPHFQTVLVLREQMELPCKEIARIVGATHVTVRWRLHRGRKLFQEEWERRRRLAEEGGDRGLLPPAPANRGGSPDVASDADDPQEALE